MTKIQLRRDTLANFTSVNPVLAEGEMAYETDTKKFKIGDGTTAYINLDYQGGGGTTITKGESTYTTLALGDNLVVADGVVNANLDEIGSELGDLSSRVTTTEAKIAHKQDILTAGDGISIVQKYANELEKVYYDGKGNVLSDVSNYEVKYEQNNNLFVYDNLNLSNKFEFSVRVPTSVLKSEKNHLTINFSSTINNSKYDGIGIQILKRNSGLTYQMGIMARNTNWSTNSTFSYESVPDYFDITVTRAEMSTKILHFKFQCPLDSSAYEFDWDDGDYKYGGIFPLNSDGLHLMIAMGWGDPFTGDFSNVNFSYDSLGELKTTISSTIQCPTKTSELTNDSGFITAHSSPVLDVPVNNCVLAMPTVPTFDGTNVKVYAGTKVAIPNGLNADGTCKSNIVTLSADATINQSTYNGDVTLMLKPDGKIDQTAYSYFEVDDISTIETLTAYCWYYDRKTNNHYLASSTGAKQGPYQRIVIGQYNQAEAATAKYFNINNSTVINQYNNFIWVPDWSRVKLRARSVTYTLTEPAMIFIYAGSQQNLPNTIIINGVPYDWQYIPNGHIGQSSCSWLLDAGDNYKYTGGDSNLTIREIPLKGRRVNV